MTDTLDRYPVTAEGDDQNPGGQDPGTPRGRVVKESIWTQPLEVQQAWREAVAQTRRELLAGPPLDMSEEELDELIEAEIREVRKAADAR